MCEETCGEMCEEMCELTSMTRFYVLMTCLCISVCVCLHLSCTQHEHLTHAPHRALSCILSHFPAFPKRYKWDFEVGQHYALDLSMFAVILCWSTMVPLILPFGVVYFLVKMYVDQYNILFECPNWRHHDEGATLRHDRPIIGWTAVRFLPVCLLCYQMAMAGFFSLRGTTFQFTLLVALLLAPMVAYIRWHYVFTRRTMQNMVRESVRGICSICKLFFVL